MKPVEALAVADFFDLAKYSDPDDWEIWTDHTPDKCTISVTLKCAGVGAITIQQADVTTRILPND